MYFVFIDSLNLEESNTSENNTEQNSLGNESSLSFSQVNHKNKKDDQVSLIVYSIQTTYHFKDITYYLKEIQKLMNVNSCTYRTNHMAYWL